MSSHQKCCRMGIRLVDESDTSGGGDAIPFIFSSGQVYRTTDIEIQPSPIYPNGLAGFATLSTSGDDSQQQQWHLYAEYQDPVTGKVIIKTQRTDLIQRVTDGLTVETLMTTDNSGTFNTMDLIEHTDTMAVYEGRGNFWWIPEAPSTNLYHLRTSLERGEYGNVILKRFIFEETLAPDAIPWWHEIASATYKPVAKYIF